MCCTMRVQQYCSKLFKRRNQNGRWSNEEEGSTDASEEGVEEDKGENCAGFSQSRITEDCMIASLQLGRRRNKGPWATIAE